MLGCIECFQVRDSELAEASDTPETGGDASKNCGIEGLVGREQLLNGSNDVRGERGSEGTFGGRGGEFGCSL